MYLSTDSSCYDVCGAQVIAIVEVIYRRINSGVSEITAIERYGTASLATVYIMLISGSSQRSSSSELVAAPSSLPDAIKGRKNPSDGSSTQTARLRIA